MNIDLRTHRILKADIAPDGQSEFPVAIPLLSCSFELERLVGTPEKPGTANGIILMFDEQAGTIQAFVNWLERKDDVGKVTLENYKQLASLADKWDIPMLLHDIDLFLCVSLEPSIDLWLFAQRYDLNYLKRRCVESIRVQQEFVQMDPLVLCKQNVPMEGIECLLGQLWENTGWGPVQKSPDRSTFEGSDHLYAVR